jgi:uncharacterized protein GlcG (DUF336 family)
MVFTVRIANITAEAAQTVVSAAVAPGLADGCPIAAAVVDAAGGLVAFLRAPGTPFHSADIAQDKAYTSAAFKQPSEALYAQISTNDGLRQGLLSRSRLAMFGGGLPIVIDGECIGAIGVSGGSEEFDIACARAGLDALGR